MIGVIKDIVSIVERIEERISSAIETAKLAREGADEIAIVLERAIAKARWKRKLDG